MSKKVQISIIIGILFFLISYDFGMFWDNVLFASKMGNHLYYNDILNWTIPESFDPGHPPFLAFLLAVVWKLFGHSLWVSHLTMLPFTIGTIYQLYRFVSYYTNSNNISFIGLLLLLMDPTLMTSFVLVNPETIILFFFFLGINGILYNNKRWKFIGLFFLSIITFRSMMLFAGLFIFEVLNYYIIQKKKIKQVLNFQLLGFYFISALPGITFVTWRLLTKGWLQTHSTSPWESLWKVPDIKQFLNNIFILIWRYLDFGRVFIFIFLIISLWSLRKKITLNNSIQQLVILGFSSVIYIIIAVLFSTNAFGHRYFITSYICFILIAFLIILKLKKYRKTIYILLITGLMTGNLWVYPEKISQGWDASLAHVPYHELRKNAINYLDIEKIDLKQVGTFFPNYNTIDEIDLNGDSRTFTHFNKKNKYVIYSNVFNLTDEELKSLQNNFIEIKQFKKLQIYISIYQSIEE